MCPSRILTIPIGFTPNSAPSYPVNLVIAGAPALVVGGIGELLTPYLRSIGWLGEKDTFRKIGFVIALAAPMIAATRGAIRWSSASAGKRRDSTPIMHAHGR